jgi:hypothetical protein
MPGRSAARTRLFTDRYNPGVNAAPRRRFWELAGSLLAAAVFFWTPAGVLGQEEEPPASEMPDGEVEVSLGSFGVGGVARAGEWTAVRIITTDHAPAPRQIIIRATLEDIDGDRAHYERTVASNPGVRQQAWLYFRLPMGFDGGQPVEVTVSEAVESGAGFEPGRLLAQDQLTARTVLPAYVGLIGVVGGRSVGLEQYTVRPQGQAHAFTPGGHEATEVTASIPPDGLSDRWMGLMQFDAIAWTGDQPGKLDADRAAALKEWVERGGHLIIIMPPVGQSWLGDEMYNPLVDILPRVTANRREGVPLEPYRPLLADDAPNSPPLPATAVVHEFTAVSEAGPHDAIPIFSNPPGAGRAGASVVVRRLVGAGAVTLVGIDLANSGLQIHGRPEADIFWHRVLGRRGKLHTIREVTGDAQTSPPDWLVEDRQQAIYDRVIGPMVNMTSSASKGVLLGFVVFIAYWLVAAPVSYAVLRRWGLARHSWVAYAITAGIFTGIAWGGATLIKPIRVEGSHVTLLDHVYGQQTQRTRTWTSLLIPWYGEATVTVGEPGAPSGSGGALQNTVAPWDASSYGDEAGSFPDARGYRVDSRSPDSLKFPTRSTVKQLQLDWAGGPRWEMPRPVLSADDLSAGSIVLLPPRTGEDTSTLRGSLVHNMPAPMVNVRVIVVKRQRPLSSRSPTEFLIELEVWQPADPWRPGQVLDLGAITRAAANSKVMQPDAYFDNLLLPSLAGGVGEAVRSVDEPTALAALGFISQLRTGGTVSRAISAERQASHGWDLGRWFTQPCVIVIGQVGHQSGTARAPSPTPVYVDGRAAPVLGVTVVRWMYPLPANPPVYRQAEDGG